MAPSNKKIKKETYESYSQVDSPQGLFTSSSMEFPDRKSAKRIPRVEEGIGTDSIVDSLGIVHPETQELLTVGEAISLRILDVRTGMFNTVINNKMTPISIQSAVKYGLIDGKLAEKLLGPCGVFDNGREISLLEAIQQNISEAESGNSLEYLMKVRTIPVTVEQKDPTLSQKFYFSKFGNNNMTIQHAMEKGVLDSEVVTLENGDKIPIGEAYKKGILSSQTYERMFGRETGLSLMDALDHGLVDANGFIYDRNKGGKLDLEEAIKKNLINPNFREIVDSGKDIKITVKEAVANKILDPKSGRYHHIASNELLPYHEAQRRKLIIKPMTLKEAVESRIYFDNGQILSPTHNRKISLLEAIGCGVLDENRIKCVTNSKNNELVTLNQAIALDIIRIDGTFRDSSSGEIMSIPEAVSQGLITSVTIRSIFDIDAFEDNNEFVSLNTALDRKLIILRGNEVVFKHKNNIFTLEEGCRKGIIRPEVLGMLKKEIGIYDESGKELTVIEAVLKGYIDPKRGMLVNTKTGKLIPTSDAIAKGIITEDGVALFNSLLIVTLTTQTITKTITTSMNTTSSEITSDKMVLPQNVKIVPVKIDSAVAGKFIPEKSKSPEESVSPPKKPRTPDVTSFIFAEKSSLEQEQPNRWIHELVEEGSPISPSSVKETPQYTKERQEKINVKTFIETTSSETIQRTETITEEIIKMRYSPEKQKIVERTVEKIKYESPEKMIKEEIRQQRTELPEAPERPIRTKHGLKKPDDFEEKPEDKTESFPIASERKSVKVGIPTTDEPGATKRVQSSASILISPAKQTNFGSSLEDPVKGPEEALKKANQAISQDFHSTVITTNVEKTRRVSPERPARKKSKSPAKTSTSTPQDFESKEPQTTKAEESTKVLPITTTEPYDIKTPSEKEIIYTPKKESEDKSVKTIISEGDTITHQRFVDAEKRSTANQFFTKRDESPEGAKTTTTTKRMRSPDKTVKTLIAKTETVEFKEHSPERVSGSPEKIIKAVITGKPHVPCIVKPNKVPLSPGDDSSPEKVVRSIISVDETSQQGIGKVDSKNEEPKDRSEGIMEPIKEWKSPSKEEKDARTPANNLKSKEVEHSKTPRETKNRTESPNFGENIITIISSEDAPTNLDILSEDKNLELPLEGWYLVEAIDQKLFDPVTGMFVIPKTDRLVSFNECIQLGIIHPESAVVVHNANNQRLISIDRSLQKRILDSTGHYHFDREDKAAEPITMKEAIDRGLIILEKRTHDIEGTPRKFKITKIVGRPDLIEISDKNQTFVEIKRTENVPSVATLGEKPLEILSDTPVDEIISAVKDGRIESHLVRVKDPNSGETINITEALQRGIIDKTTGEYRDKTGRKISATDAAKCGLIVVLYAPVAAATRVVKSIRVMFIKDPKTGKDIPIKEALEQGLITDNEYKELEAQHLDSSEEIKSTKDFLESESKDISRQKSMRSLSSSDEDEVSLGAKTRERVTTEPKYKVAIGRARSLSQSPDRSGKPVVLQKMRKKIIKPAEGLEQGILDEKTVDILNNKNPGFTLSEALEKQEVNGDEGAIRDPQRGDVLTIKEAVDRGVLNSSTKEVELLIPIARSLSIPEVVNQGLVSGNGNIVHPETGDELSLGEAILCEIVNPLTTLTDEKGEKITLQDAIKNGKLDDNRSVLKTKEGNLSLVAANNKKIFNEEMREEILGIPKIGMTLPVIIQRGLIQPDGMIIHPVTQDKIPIKDAIEKNFIMTSVPHPVAQKSVPLLDAIEENLIDTEKKIFRDPESGQEMSVKDAVKLGLLVVKPEQNEKVVEVVKSYHTVTRKTIELIPGYFLVAPNKIQNEKSGEIISLEEAIQKNIAKEVSETKEVMNEEPESVKSDVSDVCKSTPVTQTEKAVDLPEPSEKPLNLLEAFEVLFDERTGRFINPSNPNESYDINEAMSKNIIDPDALLMIEGKKIPTDVVVKKGLINPETGTFKNKTGKEISIKEACKIGFLGVVGAPILAGIKITEAVKNKFGKPESPEKITPTPPTRKLKETSVSPAKEIETIMTSPAKEVEAIMTTPARTVATQPENLEKRKVIKTLRVVLNPELSVKDFADRGAYDEVTNEFLDPKTQKPITFEKWIVVLLRPEWIFVKNPSDPEKVVTIKYALENGIVDPIKGTIRGPKTGKTVSFFDALKLGWITEKPETITFQSAVESGLIDGRTGNVKHPKTGKLINVFLAVESGIIDPNTINMKNPTNNEIISVAEAVDSGILNLEKGVIINPNTQDTIGFIDAFKKGILVTSQRKPISLEAIIVKKLYDPKSGKVEDRTTQKKFSVDEAIQSGLIDSSISECKDKKTGKWMTLEDAVNSKLINGKTGKLKDTVSGKEFNFEEALKEGLIRTTPVKISLIDSINRNYYSPISGTFLNPATAEEETLNKAIANDFVDENSAKVKDNAKDLAVSLKEAINTGLVDAEEGVLTHPKMTLNVALEKGYLLSTKKPISLQETLAQGSYEPNSGLVVLDTQDKITLEEAVRRGEIKNDALTVKDPRSRDLITLADAIEIGVIDPKLGRARDPATSDEMHFYDALDRGLIIPAKRKFSLPEAVFKGFYDPKTGEFIDPETKEKMPTDKAILKGVIDPESTLVKKPDGSVVTFDAAVERGIVDPKTGTLPKSGLHGTKLDFQEAFDQGLLVEVRQPVSLNEAIVKKMLNVKTNKFLDPKTGETLSLKEALEKNVIDADSVNVKDTRCGTWKKMSLLEAIREGLVDGDRAVVKDVAKGREHSLSEAFEVGLLIDSKAAVSLQRAIHQGLYDEETGKFTDPNTERKITLHESIRRFIINPLLPCYWSKKTGKLMSLSESCRSGIIDRRGGTFREPGSNRSVPLSEALELGLIVDIETANFGLYEAILMGLCDDSGKFVVPSTGRKVNLNEAIKEELINPIASTIKNSASGKYVKLYEAISPLKIIDDEKGLYVIGDKSMTLKEAQSKNLIIPSKRPLSIEDAIKHGLFRSDIGRFIDPETGSNVDLMQGINSGLLTTELTMIKDPVTQKMTNINAAIEHGTIDVERGVVINQKDNTSYPLDVALAKNILVVLERPLTLQQPADEDSQKESLPKKCSLEEWIKHGLIDPENAVVKDPSSGLYKSVKQAIIDGNIDLQKKGTYELQTGKARTMCIFFEQGIIVFLKEPMTFEKAVESSHLNVVTGKFKDPETKELLTLKEAVQAGIIDPDSAVVKDVTKSKLVKLPDAFRKGLIDSEKANVVDTESSKLYTLSTAIDSGLILTPRVGLSLIESLKYSLYNPITGGFTDPFLTQNIIDRKRLTLNEAIATGLIDPSSTIVKNSADGSMTPLTGAIVSGLVDGDAGRVKDTLEDKDLDLLKAQQKGLVLTAKARVSINTKFININICNW